MSRKEPKLRPSLSISDMLLLSKVLGEAIKARVKAGNTGKETLQVAQLKEYVDSFKPAQIDNMSLLAKYMDDPSELDDKPTFNLAKDNSIQDLQVIQQTKQHECCLDDPELSDEDKYDMLKLRDESTYSEREKVFILNVGTLIMMRRASKKSVNSDDL